MIINSCYANCKECDGVTVRHLGNNRYECLDSYKILTYSINKQHLYEIK